MQLINAIYYNMYVRVLMVHTYTALMAPVYIMYATLPLVWLARPSHLNAQGAEGEGRSSGSTISSHLHIINLTLCVRVENTTYDPPKLRKSNV